MALMSDSKKIAFSGDRMCVLVWIGDGRSEISVPVTTEYLTDKFHQKNLTRQQLVELARSDIEDIRHIVEKKVRSGIPLSHVIVSQSDLQEV